MDEFSHVCLDSRNAQKGSLFFALKGERTDGHAFLSQAYKNGAATAVVSQDFSGQAPDGLRLIRVADTLLELQRRARERVKKVAPFIIAITGSYGKTTTKDFLSSLLAPYYTSVATIGSQNSQAGLPMFILNNLQHHHTHLVVEMGMDEKGGIRRLIDIAPPDIAMITSIGLVHAENFEGLSEIAHAKAEIFEHPKTTLCLYNSDTHHADILARIAGQRGRSFGQSGYTSYLLSEELQITENNQTQHLPLPTFDAPHLYDNLLAAIAAARATGLSWQQIDKAFSNLKTPERRLQRTSLNGIEFINDSYNASEVPMKAALSTLSRQSQKRKIGVLAEMLCLGNVSHECHRRVGEHALDCADQLFCLGKECLPIVDVWKDNNRDVYWFSSKEELVSELKSHLREGDVVLLKGSKSHQLWTILEALSQ